ncbi:hypothetical protein PR048_014125 [Dryococelus australis]|uniref:Uncharacterized protein n=1 Tax=Dryococelus australis TaxID=614101 RepID=A0ABQ9HE40_9NEOP|nr:hypothetical protein PR048_014125 [Dryococelus australis]
MQGPVLQRVIIWPTISLHIFLFLPQNFLQGECRYLSQINFEIDQVGGRQASDFGCELLEGTVRGVVYCDKLQNDILRSHYAYPHVPLNSRDYPPPIKANRVRFLAGGVPGFSGIVLDKAVGRRIFSGISRFPRPCIPVCLHTTLTSPASALKTPIGNSLDSHSGGPGFDSRSGHLISAFHDFPKSLQTNDRIARRKNIAFTRFDVLTEQNNCIQREYLNQPYAFPNTNSVPEPELKLLAVSESLESSPEERKKRQLGQGPGSGSTDLEDSCSRAGKMKFECLIMGHFVLKWVIIGQWVMGQMVNGSWVVCQMVNGSWVKGSMGHRLVIDSDFSRVCRLKHNEESKQKRNGGAVPFLWGYPFSDFLQDALETGLVSDWLPLGTP